MSNPASEAPAAQSPNVSAVIAGLTFYYFTSLIVFAGVSFGINFIPLQASSRDAKAVGYLKALTNRSGGWYASIARDGYSYDPKRASNINFFPAYPLAGRILAQLTGMSVELALVIVANTCFLSAFVVFGLYLEGSKVVDRIKVREWALLALGLWPVTFFCRMAYGEAPFLFLAILSLYGMQQRWPNWTVAIIIGLATSCRPVGVALCPVLMWHICEGDRPLASLLKGLPMLFLSVWGLAAFMLYQYVAFGDPLTFNKSHEFWSGMQTPWYERLGWTLIMEPVWSKYWPGCTRAWWMSERVANPLFSLDFANPLFFLVTIALVVYGKHRRWIDTRESILAAFLILIPYFTQGHRFGMEGHGRFTSVVFPIYIVMGHLLSRLPPQIACLVLAGCGFMLGIYSALFASLHRFY